MWLFETELKQHLVFQLNCTEYLHHMLAGLLVTVTAAPPLQDVGQAIRGHTSVWTTLLRWWYQQERKRVVIHICPMQKNIDTTPVSFNEFTDILYTETD